jgi:hypothetical protein
MWPKAAVKYVGFNQSRTNALKNTSGNKVMLKPVYREVFATRI